MSKNNKRIAYQEFGAIANSAATERATPDLPPEKQDLRVQTSRKGRKGKTVTVVTGFQHSPDTLKAVLKKLKSQCGSGGTAKDDFLEIQGDHRDKLVEFLIQMGYKAKASGG
ncbi:MAG: translation initiation factor [Cyanobacteriota bacterium]